MSEAGVDDPLVGKVLSGRFQIVEPLGVGGMGRVYKAIQQPLDRVVALKVLNPRYDGTKDPGFERRFFLEASMTAKLKHPNTITVHDYGRTDEGIYFIAMEYLEGDTLQQVLSREGPLAWARALTVAGQVARSLREAHKLGLVHRDLKPANVMLLSEGTGGDVVKVLDFGLVKAFASDLMQKSDTELTQAGVLLGSPLYMAPEQAKGHTDQRTDIYSLGVLVFQCIAGRPPFQGKDSIDIIVKHVKEKPPELRTLVADVPDEVNALVMKCLEKNPANRFQTMDELLEAMRVAVSGQGMSGLFIDPRTNSNPMVATAQPARSTTSTRLKIASPSVLDPTATRSERPPDIEQELVKSLEVEITASGTHPGGRKKGPMLVAVTALVLLGVAVGGVLAVQSQRQVDPRPTPTPPPVVKPPEVKPAPVEPTKPTAVEVRFSIDSEPQGATVSRDGAVIGTTPFDFGLVRTGEAPVQVELVFALEGHVGTTLVAQGADGTVVVKPTLAKKRAPTPVRPVRPKPPKNPTQDPGYKDDPYQ